MIDTYGTPITGLLQYTALHTTPNNGTMPDCFLERTVYTYHLINSQDVQCGRLEMDVIQAHAYAQANSLMIIKEW
jgi:hypothetical protein